MVKFLCDALKVSREVSESFLQFVGMLACELDTTRAVEHSLIQQFVVTVGLLVKGLHDNNSVGKHVNTNTFSNFVSKLIFKIRIDSAALILKCWLLL